MKRRWLHRPFLQCGDCKSIFPGSLWPKPLSHYQEPVGGFHPSWDQACDCEQTMAQVPAVGQRAGDKQEDVPQSARAGRNELPGRREPSWSSFSSSILQVTDPFWFHRASQA